jgi:hypothetical protein|tara:strand:- start:793 stop:1344 length:552 start_codon:yes stop_codon:yes gene_type:complete
MVVAETMAAIALAKGAVSGVKSVINTCKDISEISGQIDQMFQAHEQVHKKSSAKGNEAWNNYLTQKLKDGDEEEGESFSDVTAEIIEKKQIEEQMVAMQRMLNKRFGPDTWNEIVDLREERQKENKIKRSKAKEKFLVDRERKRKRMKYWLQQAGNTIILITAVVGIWWWLSYLIECAGKCFK